MPLRFLIVPDSFKGSLSSEQAAEAIRRGVLKSFPDAEVRCFPMADGGEGSSAIAAEGLDAKRIEQQVFGPEGEPVQGFYYFAEPTALIELAAASGFTLSKRPAETAAQATTYGTGQLIADAVSRGATEIRLFLGGSATTDGGVGIAKALGARFYDEAGRDIPSVEQCLERGAPFSGEQLGDIARYDDHALKSNLSKVDLAAVVDVDNPLCGPRGAAHTYGPQKGADPETVALLDAALANLARVAAAHTGEDHRDEPGSGAAGGCGFGVLALLGGRLVSGSSFFLDLIAYEKLLGDTDIVITGEGKTDQQSLQGKLLSEVCRRSGGSNAKVLCLCGKNELSEEEYQHFPQLSVFQLEGNDPIARAADALSELAAKVTRQSQSSS